MNSNSPLELTVSSNVLFSELDLMSISQLVLLTLPTQVCSLPFVHRNHVIVEAYVGKRYNCGSFLAMIHNRSLLLYHSNLDTVNVYNHVCD